MNHVANVLDNNRPAQSYEAQPSSGTYLTQGPDAPPSTSILGAAERQAQQHTRALVDVAERLQAVRDRAFGAEPMGAGHGPENGPVNGAVQQLAAAIQPHDQLVARMHSLINDLDGLA